MLGCCIGFLWYNSFPAQVFMGDTGSLGLGGALGALAVLTKTELLLPIIGGVFVVEALSVIIQVVSFRRYGRRIFLMAPIHHHFEMKAWSETTIIVRFWIVAAMLAGLGLRARLPALQPVHLMDETLAGARRAVVLGAVRSGIAAAEALTRCAPHVHVVLADRRPDAGEAPAGVEAVPGRDDPELLAGADLLVKSPGVPEEAAIVRAARSAGIPVWAEVELAYRLLEERNPIVGITGTNGKTTTTLLTAAMLERGGVPSVSAGNVGTALSSFAGASSPAARSCASSRAFSSKASSASAPTSACCST